MAIFKCKMCGAALEVNNETTATCEYCGTAQTLPKLNDEKIANLYDRANHFRRNNEYDKAKNIFEQILDEDTKDAEAYWSLVLCKYGIEYVEDPVTRKRVPTVNRTQFTSVFDDDNYKKALEYADAVQKRLYEEEAKTINDIQKGILAISNQEAPFDVFICYKETDNAGRRTMDSVLAQELYNELTKEGFKVFFSRITLEDKLGTAYEPYIFAALNSAKVMVVVGTRPEHFNAVWVKNEWSRYLGFIKGGAQKTLIPAYKDMDPYDLPEAFSHLQAQDMNKLGFMQDLVRGIKKIICKDEAKEQKAVLEKNVEQTAGANIDALLKRVFMFLEDKKWESADEYCERILDIDPENIYAYLGKMMAEIKCGRREDLREYEFEDSKNYSKIERYGDASLLEELKGYTSEYKYNMAVGEMERANTALAYTHAADSFEEILGYKDAREKQEECMERAKETEYQDALKIMEGARSEKVYHQAAELFGALLGYKDADEKQAECLEKVEEIIMKRQLGRKEIKEAAEKIQEIRDILMKKEDEIERLNKQKLKLVIFKRKEKEEIDQSISAIKNEIMALKKSDAVILEEMRNGKYVSKKELEGMIAVGNDYTIGLKADGTVVAVGSNEYGQCKVSDWRDIIAIAAGGYHTVGLKKDGTVVAVGLNKDGQCKVSNWRDIIAIKAGCFYTVGLKSDGTVVVVGSNHSGQCKVSDWQDIIAIAAGCSHTVGLKSDGTVVAVGDNSSGQCKVSDWRDIIAIAANGSHTLGLKSDGTVVAVGDNKYGQCRVFDWRDIIVIAAGSSNTVGLKSDGTIVAVGNKDFGKSKVSGWRDIIAIAVGTFHTVGLKSDGTVVAVGDNSLGRCNVETWELF